MGMKIEAGEYSRTEDLMIDPQEILCEETTNNRFSSNGDIAGHTPEDVDERVKSFEKEGQLQSVEVRKLANKHVQLVFGYLRWLAALEYNKRHPEAPMRLRCRVVNINEEEAYERNIVENMERKKLTVMDFAMIHRNLSEKRGWTDIQIAQFIKIDNKPVSPSYIGQIKKLLMLPMAYQVKVHKGDMSLNDAMLVVELPKEELQKLEAEHQQPMVESSVANSNGEMVHSEQIEIQPSSNGEMIHSKEVSEKSEQSFSDKLRDKVRETKIAKGGKQARTQKEIRKFWTKFVEEDNHPLKELSKLILKFNEGGYIDRTMENKLVDLITVKQNQEDFAHRVEMEQIEHDKNRS